MSNKSVLHSIGFLLAGNTLSQIISLVSIPIISRVYSPDIIGDFGVFMSIVAFINVASTAKYDKAIVYCQDNIAILTLFGSIIISLLYSLLIVPICYLCSIVFSVHYDYNVLSRLWYIIPVIVMLSAIYNSIMAFINQRGLYKKMSLGGITQSAVGSSSKILLGLRLPNTFSLIISHSIGLLIGILYLYSRKILKYNHLSISRIWIVLKSKYKFPLYNVPYGYIEYFGTSAIIVVLGMSYNRAEIGLFSMSYMILRNPIILISDSVSKVFMKRESITYNESKSIRCSTLRSMRYFFYCVPPLVIIIYLVAPYVVEPLLGQKWVNIITIIFWMIPRLTINSFTAIFNYLPDLLSKQKSHLFVRMILTFIDIIIMVLLVSFVSFDQFIPLYFSLTSILWFFYALYLIKLL